MFGMMELGPLAEKPATLGAEWSCLVLVADIYALRVVPACLVSTDS